MSAVREAETDAEIARLFPLFQELRPHLTDAADFVGRARRQMQEANWRLIYAEEDGGPVAAAGFRISQWLAWGKTLYVDDLICREISRGKGHAEKLMRWMEDHARREGCAQFHLDSGTHRHPAHRFYHRLGLSITSFHFSKKL
jgi:GNAT superfamily N-acetyltransferase